MELQEYLRQHGLETLCATYQIKVTRHRQYPELACLKYSQIESPLGEKIVQQCRGIILDESQDWQIVSYPYDKFFNYGEGHAAAIDWKTAKVYEKLDGSLTVLYFTKENGESKRAALPMQRSKLTVLAFNFAELFWKVWQELGYQLPSATDECFIFELMTPYNRIVVQQANNRIALHGVRNIQTLRESDPSFWADKYGWELVASYP
ncbi:MAG: hypothetical protein HC894_08585 [Microcoleus sp. SM1_3_4]|nr:hypothetical protein [Microcoleus sp. SM1_3_4]